VYEDALRYYESLSTMGSAMLVKIVVKLLGGVWRLRVRCLASTILPARKLYSGIYAYYLQSFGASIPLSATFAGAPVFPHGPYGVFISGAARIGKNCVIFQHVVIGSNSLIDSERRGAPIIGDSCYIGVGAKIIGNVKVGNNVRIAANTVVYRDVPDNCVVTSGVQRVIPNKGEKNNKFYHKYRHQWRCFDNGEWIAVKDPQELFLLEHSFPGNEQE
jgi:serine O-acetyltransferase